MFQNRLGWCFCFWVFVDFVFFTYVGVAGRGGDACSAFRFGI